MSNTTTLTKKIEYSKEKKEVRLYRGGKDDCTLINALQEEYPGLKKASDIEDRKYGIDAIYTDNGEVTTIQLKTSSQRTLIYEIDKSYDYNELCKITDFNQGKDTKSKADVFLYYIPKDNTFYIIPHSILKEIAIDYVKKMLKEKNLKYKGLYGTCHIIRDPEKHYYKIVFHGIPYNFWNHHRDDVKRISVPKKLDLHCLK